MRRCKVERCGRPTAPDVPVCIDHWRSVPLDLRRVWLSAGRRVVRAAERTEVQP